METAKFHAQLDRNAEFDETIQHFEEVGFISFIRRTRVCMNERLNDLGIIASDDFLGRQEVEMLTLPEQDGAVVLKKREQSLISLQGFQLELLIISRSSVSQFEEPMRAVLAEKLEQHSWVEAEAIGRIRDMLGQLSPNGRKLADETFRMGARRLYDDELRSQVGAVVRTFQNVPVSRESLAQLDCFQNDPGRLDVLLADENVFRPRSTIYCAKCDHILLPFANPDEARLALDSSDNSCTSCGGRLGLLETFALNNPLREGLQQGLWLESLVSDLVTEGADFVLTGQMVRSREIDVLAVLADRTVLFECKDASFGQTELAMTSVKAESIGADLVVVVSTHDLHANVQNDIDEFSRTREFKVIAKSTSVEIKDELARLLEDLRAESTRAWLSRSRAALPFLAQSLGI